jgi:hypothetical protein
VRLRIAAGAFIALHGLVHAMYIGQALRWFELRDGMTWPDGAVFLPMASDRAVKVFAAITIGISSLALVVGGVAIAMNAGWGRPLTLVAAIAASLSHVLLWNGDIRTSPDQGLYGVIINIAIAAWILVTS